MSSFATTGTRVVDYVILAEFDIYKGSCVRTRFPISSSVNSILSSALVSTSSPLGGPSVPNTPAAAAALESGVNNAHSEYQSSYASTAAAAAATSPSGGGGTTGGSMMHIGSDGNLLIPRGERELERARLDAEIASLDDYFADHMLPDGAERQSVTKTVFIVNRSKPECVFEALTFRFRLNATAANDSNIIISPPHGLNSTINSNPGGSATAAVESTSTTAIASAQGQSSGSSNTVTSSQWDRQPCSANSLAPEIVSIDPTDGTIKIRSAIKSSTTNSSFAGSGRNATSGAQSTNGTMDYDMVQTVRTLPSEITHFLVSLRQQYTQNSSVSSVFSAGNHTLDLAASMVLLMVSINGHHEGLLVSADKAPELSKILHAAYAASSSAKHDDDDDDDDDDGDDTSANNRSASTPLVENYKKKKTISSQPPAANSMEEEEEEDSGESGNLRNAGYGTTTSMTSAAGSNSLGGGGGGIAIDAANRDSFISTSERSSYTSRHKRRGGASKLPTLFGLCAVVTKKDSSVKRGAINKSVAILGQHLAWLEPFFPVLVETAFRCCEIKGVENDSIAKQTEVLQRCFEAINRTSEGMWLHTPLLLVSNIVLTEKERAKAAEEYLDHDVEHVCLSTGWEDASGPARKPTEDSVVQSRECAPFGTKHIVSLPQVPQMLDLSFSNYNLEVLLYLFGSSFFRVLIPAILSEKRIVVLARQGNAMDVGDVALSLGVIGSLIDPFFITKKVFPYISVSSMDKCSSVKGYIVGTVNPIFESQKMWWDVMCDLDNGTIVLPSDGEKKSKHSSHHSSHAPSQYPMSPLAVPGQFGSPSSGQPLGGALSAYALPSAAAGTLGSVSGAAMDMAATAIRQASALAIGSPAADGEPAVDGATLASLHERYDMDDLMMLQLSSATAGTSVEVRLALYDEEQARFLLQRLSHMRALQINPKHRIRTVMLYLEEYLHTLIIAAVHGQILPSPLADTFSIIHAQRMEEMRRSSILDGMPDRILRDGETEQFVIDLAVIRRCGKKNDLELLHAMQNLLRFIRSDKAVMLLLRRMPAAIGGLDSIAAKLFHPSVVIRLTAVTLLRRIEDVKPSGRRAIAMMRSVFVMAYSQGLRTLPSRRFD